MRALSHFLPGETGFSYTDIPSVDSVLKSAGMFFGVAIFEELSMRGYALQRTMRGIGIGIGTGWGLYLRTGSLALPIGVHWGWNGSNAQGLPADRPHAGNAYAA